MLLLYRGLSHCARRILPRRRAGQVYRAATSSQTDADEAPKKDSQKRGSLLLSSPTAAKIGIPSLKGVGQVIFLNNPKCGGLILASLAIGDPYLAALAATGATASTATARLAQLDADQTNKGLLSYNGSLVGCATAVFLVPSTQNLLAAAAVTCGGAAATTFLSVSLGHYLSSQPQWTYSFNLVTLSMLLRHYTPPPVVVETTPPPAVAVMDILCTPLTGLSQIFVVQNAWTGLGIAVAIAHYSPQLAGHALLGSTVGSAVGYWTMNAPASEVAAGLWGYNGALTSMAVAVFGVSSSTKNPWPLLVLSAGGAAASSLVFGALSSSFGVPCLTLPFCLTTSALYPLLLEHRVPGVALANDPHSPERNTPV